MRVEIVAAALLAIGSAAMAAESQIKLKDSHGVRQVEANCSACHSLDYIQLNSKFLDRKGWEAEVNKMIKTFGAPVQEQDVAVIVDYLTRDYGKK